MFGTYLDYAAHAPLMPEAAAVYQEFCNMPGNASSSHFYGRHMRAVIEKAKEGILTALNAPPGTEVSFTSGGTESINTCIYGTYLFRNSFVSHINDGNISKKIILANPADHTAQLSSIKSLPYAEIVWLPIDKYARVLPDSLEQAILQKDPNKIALFACTWVNSELGTISPVYDYARICQTYDIPVHIDAVAATSLIDFSRLAGKVSLSIAGHKIGAPSGTGAILSSFSFPPLLRGGNQQRLRSGSVDPLGSTSLSIALNRKVQSLRALRQRLVEVVLSAVPEAVVNSDTQDSSDAILNVSFPGCSSDTLLYLFDEAKIAISSGSACHSGVIQPSHVMSAVGLKPDLAKATLRFSLGWASTFDDIEVLSQNLGDIYKKALIAK